MKLFRIDLHMTGPLGTVMKGDTMFGHLVWQLAQDADLAGPVDALLADYDTHPFAVLSSAFPSHEDEIALPVPVLPADLLFGEQRADQRKEQKKKRWLLWNAEKPLQVDADQCLSDKDLMKGWSADAAGKGPFVEVERIRNTIHRLTGRTGEGRFAPFRSSARWLAPGLSMSLIAGLDERMSEQALVEALKRIGHFGFGRNASVGMGQFTVKQCKALPDMSDGNAAYALSPFVPVDQVTVFSRPFTRFGRHGNVLATSSHPFKEPVLLMDEAAVLYYESHPPQFTGKGLRGVSRHKPTVMQGFTVLLPFHLKGLTL